MTIALQTTNKEPFTMIPDKCFGHIEFDNVYQQTVYMALKKFANANNQCFPGLKKIAEATLISKRKVQNTLKELKNKYLIDIENRFKEDGSRTSNLYTIYELPNPCNAVNIKNVSITTTVKNTENIENTESIETVETTENVAITKNADKEITIASLLEQYKEFISRMEADGFIVLKKDDVPVELQDKSVLKSLPEMVSNDTIIAQDELVEENQVTEMEEKIETISEDSAVQENESVLNNATMPKNENTTIGKKIMSKLKNITRKEKKPTSATNKTADVSNINKSSNDDNTTQTAKSQPLETYSLEWLKEHFCYNAIIDKLIDKYPDSQEEIDVVFDILYTNINATNKRTRINGDEKPPMVIRSKFLKLDSEDIIYAIEKFLQQTIKIKNPIGYLTTLLFNAHEQRCLEMENLKQHDKAKQNGQSTEPQPYPKNWQPRQNQFNQFMQRETTPEELDELERRLLGNFDFINDNISTEQD